MKKTILALLAVGAFSAIAFYASQSTTPTPTAEVAVVPAPATSKPASSVAQPVVKPVVPAVVPPSAPVVQVAPVAPVAAAPQPAASQAGSASLRTELATTIPELARLIDAQDFETLMQDFMPPDELSALLASVGTPGAPMTLETLAGRMRQNPKVMQQMANASKFMAFLQTQTPTFDPSGESASYPIPKVVNGQNTINFVKVGGYWYVKNGVQFFK